MSTKTTPATKKETPVTEKKAAAAATAPGRSLLDVARDMDKLLKGQTKVDAKLDAVQKKIALLEKEKQNIVDEVGYFDERMEALEAEHVELLSAAKA
ncbi:MAG: hypothetical protein B0D91_10625 [Oceanospirillales bacterium LUC14_002_19_P2]|nr:MAG: hypothetical protein B0D91_10625 [Oceanospirillales bacterium LUC14_002_19_P2]